MWMERMRGVSSQSLSGNASIFDYYRTAIAAQGIYLARLHDFVSCSSGLSQRSLSAWQLIHTILISSREIIDSENQRDSARGDR